MSIDNELKKNIYKSWLEHYPDLNAYNKDKFYKVVGPMVVGIELIKLPTSEVYRPHFMIYPLWSESEKICMRAPILQMQIMNAKGRQLDIPYSDHEKWKIEAFECIKRQIIPLDGDVRMDDFLDLIHEQLKLNFGPADEAAKFELKLFAAVYVSNWQLTEDTLDTILEVGKNWNPLGFDFVYGPFDKWYKSLEEKVRNRDLFLSQISRNLEGPKLSKLKRSELIP